MTLHLHRAERADVLVGVLGSLLLEPLSDPMTPEIVCVPTRGVERWITQQLSSALGTTAGRSDGVCANIDFPFPGRLIGGALRSAAGDDPSADVWRPERLVWPLIDVVERSLDEPWLAGLAAHLHGAHADEVASNRRFGAVRHIADLFDRYSVHRPDMVRAWSAGDDLDGHGQPLAADVAWQAELWRRLRSEVGTASLAERLDDGCRSIRDDPDSVDLPERFSLFGLTRLPVSQVDVLRSLAENRDVHLFLLHPSPTLWSRIATHPDPAGVRPRSDDTTDRLPQNPLLRSWGRDAREMQLVLSSAGADVIDVHHPTDESPSTLLQRIQHDIRNDREPDADRPLLDEDDRSVQVHACHGRARQVEVLRDALLHVLRDDPTLEPRDVIVMCPDIETFARLLHATFGGGSVAAEFDDGASGSPIDLRVRLADRSIRQTNPVLSALSDLLALADARLTASQVLDLAGREAIRRRFGFDDDDLDRLEGWVATSGIRWGLDADHRADYDLAGLAANTWRAGLDRVLLGAAMAEDDPSLFGGVLPLDDVGSGDLDLVGRFAEFVDRLDEVTRALRLPRTVAGWAEELTRTTSLLTATGERDEWQVIELRRLLDDMADEATVDGAAATHELGLGEVRALLADRLRGRPTRANFRTGHLTVCTLVPMRSVPHRVVCLLGLDDATFPRRSADDGDDLVTRAPCVGDRDTRGEDRQLLLDAVMAAKDHLLVTYCGRDERTNHELPPAVPVLELLDLVDATCRLPDVDDRPVRVRDRIVTDHPLQPFDARNYGDAALGRPGPWSYDQLNLSAAIAARAARSPVAPFLTTPLPDRPADVVGLSDLERFLRHPMRAFLRQRLGISLVDDDAEVADAVPIELDALRRWGVGQRMLEAALDGADLDAIQSAELARGGLPPGVFGEASVEKLSATIGRLVGTADRLCPDRDDRTAVDTDVLLPSGIAVTGVVADVVGETVLGVTFSNLGPAHRLLGWVRLLLLTAADPSVAWRAVTVGKYKSGSQVSTLGPLAGDGEARGTVATDHLSRIVELHVRGLCEPLPLFCRTSAAYADALAGGRKAVSAGTKEWETTKPDWTKEDRDPVHELILGAGTTFGALLALPPMPGEAGDGWAMDEPSRFGRLARRLWDPLLANEVIDR